MQCVCVVMGAGLSVVSTRQLQPTIGVRTKAYRLGQDRPIQQFPHIIQRSGLHDLAQQQHHHFLNQTSHSDLVQQTFINSILKACLLGWQPTTSFSSISKACLLDLVAIRFITSFSLAGTRAWHSQRIHLITQTGWTLGLDPANRFTLLLNRRPHDQYGHNNFSTSFK